MSLDCFDNLKGGGKAHTLQKKQIRNTSVDLAPLLEAAGRPAVVHTDHHPSVTVGGGTSALLPAAA